VYDKFASSYGLKVDPGMNMNPACFVLFCLESLNRTFGFTVSEIMQRKLMESMSERILPFLWVCSKEDRRALYRLICKACADPKLIFNRANCSSSKNTTLPIQSLRAVVKASFLKMNSLPNFMVLSTTLRSVMRFRCLCNQTATYIP
jgi:hypothetical protein